MYSAVQFLGKIEASTLSANTHPVFLEPGDDLSKKDEPLSDVATASGTAETRGQSSTCDECEGDIPKSKNIDSPKKDLYQPVLEFMKERRNIPLESKLQEVFAVTTTYTAKENLLLSLRWVVDIVVI